MTGFSAAGQPVHRAAPERVLAAGHDPNLLLLEEFHSLLAID
jgi:hypothetical protein